MLNDEKFKLYYAFYFILSNNNHVLYFNADDDNINTAEETFLNYKKNCKTIKFQNIFSTYIAHGMP